MLFGTHLCSWTLKSLNLLFFCHIDIWIQVPSYQRDVCGSCSSLGLEHFKATENSAEMGHRKSNHHKGRGEEPHQKQIRCCWFVPAAPATWLAPSSEGLVGASSWPATRWYNAVALMNAGTTTPATSATSDDAYIHQVHHYLIIFSCFSFLFFGPK